MSSVISTKRTDDADTQVRPDDVAGTAARSSTQAHKPDMQVRTVEGNGAHTVRAGLAPWQFFVLAALGCATAVNVIVRGQGATTIVLLTILVATTALVGVAALRTLNPLVTEEDDRTVIIAGRTRAALEREKTLALRAIKELEFDRAMGKVSESDFDEMAGRLRGRAARLIRQLDAGAGYRDQIESDLARRVASAAATAKGSADRTSTGKAADLRTAERERGPADPSTALRVGPEQRRGAERTCACGTSNDPDARFCKACGAKLLIVFLCVLGLLGGASTVVRAQMPGAAAGGGIEMPDMKQMSGIPRPVGDLPKGTITVRVIRGSLSNNIANQEVELTVAGTVYREKTDGTGHVEFKGLPQGAAVKAVTVVDGERLESQEFPVPAQGGVRLMLVATDKEAEKRKAEEASAPAITGQVVLGGESRIVLEPGDESVQVYYLLDIANTARVRVNPPSLFTFDMPRACVGTTILEGSSPQASVNGIHVRVQGPFKPGTTSVQVACELPFTGGTLQFTQRFPATMEQLAVVAKKADAMRLVSPQLSVQQDMPADGQMYIAATGGTVPAGAPVNLTLEDLPHHSTAPRNLALTFAVGIILIGAWAVRRPVDPRARQAERQRLVARREKLFAELTRLELDARRGRGDAVRRAARREEVIAALEHIYGALDDEPQARVEVKPQAASPDGELRAS